MPKPDLPGIVRISTHIYGCLLWLCPRRYRREYGALRVQAFRDLCCDAYREGGAARVLRAWPRPFLDVCATAAAEHVAGLRLGARELQAVGVALLFALIAAALVPVLGPAARQGNRGTVAFAPAQVHDGATETVGDAVLREGAPQRRTAFTLEALPAGGQAIVANTVEPGRARFSIYLAGGQVITVDGTQPARIQLANGSQVLVFYGSQ